MLDLSKFNGKKSVFDISNSEEFKFIKKNELKFGYKYRLKAVYCSEGKFGNQTIYMFTDDFENKYRFSVSGDIGAKILSDDDMVKAIQNNEITIEFYEYKSKKFNTTCIGVTFDIDVAQNEKLPF